MLRFSQFTRKEKSRLLRGILICAALAVTGAGCAGAGRDQGADRFTERALTERQKQILRSRGLPEEYEDLTAVQKETIRKIEELLTYLEQKYARTFEFAAFRPASVRDPDAAALLFREAGADPERRTAVLTETWEEGGRILRDDFPAVAAEPVYEQFLEKQVRECLNVPCRVYGSVAGTSLLQPPETEEELPGNIAADACIWLSAEENGTDDMEELASYLRQRLREKDISGRCQIMLLTDEAWQRVSRSSFPDFFGSKDCLCRKVIRIP